MEHDLKLSVSLTGHAYLLEIQGLFTQGWRSGRSFAESVGGFLRVDSAAGSNGIRYNIFDTRPDSEFKMTVSRWDVLSLRVHSLDDVPYQPRNLNIRRVLGAYLR
jgi:hypothetical protein